MSGYTSFWAVNPGPHVVPMCLAYDSSNDWLCAMSPDVEVALSDGRLSYLCKEHRHLASHQNYTEVIKQKQGETK
jgi:hypothetical protein